MTSDLTTKAAEIRAGLVDRLREHVRSRGGLSRDAETGEIVLPNGAWAMMLEAADLIEQQAAELARLEQDKAFLKAAYATLAARADNYSERLLAAEAERDELLREKERLGAALKPFAQAAADCDVVDDLRIGVVKPADVIWESAPAVSITFGHLAAAQSALENCPAGLADANSKSPDQSERIAVLEVALSGMVRHAHETRGKAVEDAYAAARAALSQGLAPLGEE